MATDSAPSCFVPVKALPQFGDQPVGGLELCRAMEKVCGEGKVDGAMKISGLWRLQVKDRTARNALLLNGLSLRGVAVSVMGKNPFLVDGQETVKLIVGNVPFSVSDSEIAKALEALNVVLASQIKWEHYRDEGGRLTSFKTGRRFVYIGAPPSPLPQVVKVAGMFNAFLYYREREDTRTHNRDRVDSQHTETEEQNKNNDNEGDGVAGSSTEVIECTQPSSGKLTQSRLNFSKERGRQQKGQPVGEGRERSSSKRRRSNERVSKEEKRQCQEKEREGGTGGEDTESTSTLFDWFTNSDGRDKAE